MESNPYNVISFQTKNYTQAVKLNVEPKPDKKIRIFMAWYPSDVEVDITPQNFKVPDRTGKVVVEWGGSMVDPNTLEQINLKTINGVSYNNVEENDENAEETTEDEEVTTEEDLLAEQLQKLMQEQTALQNATTQAQVSTGHPFTDKNGQTTTFTDAEWQKLINTWSYTGQAEEMISHHTISELRSVLANS